MKPNYNKKQLKQFKKNSLRNAFYSLLNAAKYINEHNNEWSTAMLENSEKELKIYKFFCKEEIICKEYNKRYTNKRYLKVK